MPSEDAAMSGEAVASGRHSTVDKAGEPAAGSGSMPTLVGDYQIVSRLTGGSMAELYVARKISQFGFVHRAVIKQVKRTRPDFRQLQRMLLDEARATACFDHPNLVSIFDVGETEQGLYLALEYVEGTDLRRVNQKLRARKEALPFELACFLVAEVLRGVHHAHTARGPDGQPLEIVHRDVNPSNVLVSTSGHVKLADFGVVRMRERIQPKTEPGLVKGKYAYLAPEYIAGEPCSVQTDVYAAGIMLFELLSGRECFTGSTAYEVMWKIVNKGVPMYRLQREGVPEDLQRLVARATSMVPERRYASAQDMANALEAWLMRSGKHATPWVLSVFFHRHDLVSRPMDPAYQPLGTSASEVPTPERGPVSEGTGEVAPAWPGGRADSQPSSPAEPFRFGPTASPLRGIDDSLTPAPGSDLAGAVPPAPPRGPVTPTPNLSPDPARPIRGPLTAVPASSIEPQPGFGWTSNMDQMPEANELVPAGESAPMAGVNPLVGGDAQSGDSAASDLSPLAAPILSPVVPPLGSEPEPPADQYTVPTVPVPDPSEVASAVSAGPNAPVQDGKLEDQPAADILERLAAERASGTVEFRCGLIWKRVLMTEGKPTGVTSNMGMELIGEHLVKARIISREDLEKALQNSERLEKPLTFCLLEQGALTRAVLEIELGRNLASRLQEVLEWRWGTYSFTAQLMDPVEILPKLDLPGLLAKARSNRQNEPKPAPDSALRAPAEDGDPSQTKLKEALRVARSIAKSTGKGRVDRPFRNSKP